MRTNKKMLSLMSQGLKPKLRVAFALMCVVPLLVSFYLLFNYILPVVGFQIDVVASLLISAFLAGIGFFIVKEIFDRILSVSSDAQSLALGNITKRAEVKSLDEVGNLGEALNIFSQRIRTNMEELKTYSVQTAQINMEIQKRVLVLSGLLQISSLIAQGTRLQEVLRVIVEKLRLLANAEVAYLLLKDEGKERFSASAVDGFNAAFLSSVEVGPEDALFLRVLNSPAPLMLDSKHTDSPEIVKAFFEKFSLKNTLAETVYLRGKVIAIVGMGNNRELFEYHADDVELLDIFAKQAAITIENDLLLRRVEQLEVKDTLTGLYNEAFIRNRLQEEIRRSAIYQRPCGLIILNIDNFEKFHHSAGSLQAEAALKKIALLLLESVSEIDRAGRVGDNEFAIILPEKNKRQTQRIAEIINMKIEEIFKEDSNLDGRLTASGGVSENPLDGMNAEELIAKAKVSVGLAKAQGKNRILG